MQAATGLPVAINIYGRDTAGQIYSDHLFMGGGQGGSEAGDGVSALLWPTSAANTSVELFEQRVPVLVTEKAYVPDSGGPGRHRGGLGQRVSVRKLDGDGLPTLASVYPEGVGIAVPGLFGGKPGRSALGVVRDAAGAIITDCGTGQLVSTTTDQEIVEVCLSGGSGFGSPFERPLAAIARDLAEGYVTPEAAARDYGVVIGADGKLDMARSARTARARHGGGVTRLNAKRSVSPIAWAIAPAALLFVLFFILPFGVMAMLSFLSGNPVSNPNVSFTWRHYNRLFDSDLYFDALVATMRIGAITTLDRAADRLSAGALDGADAFARRPCAAADGGDRAAADRHRGAHLRLDDAARRPRRHQHTAQWLGLAEKPLPLMYNEFGVVVGLVHIYVPFMVLTLVGVIGRIDRTLEEAARGLGASRSAPSWK